MELYTALRAFADSWMLLALTLIFVGVVFFVFRPGATALQRDAANSIFRNEKRPAPPVEPVEREAK
ncbi:MAG: cbb3-type cytochrome c oxidase subunit 3 [Paracoccus sp. (in: a-proteobacteria)]|nr:cbb3-type cytochrome c oxidase subunit 3 [Paracoccus sp. (in: a-proteobacteria)]